MSVVNKMLKDLENRQHPVQTSANYVPPNKTKTAWLGLAGGIVTISFIAVAATLYFQQDKQLPARQSKDALYEPKKGDVIASVEPGAENLPSRSVNLDRQENLDRHANPDGANLDRHKKPNALNKVQKTPTNTHEDTMPIQREGLAELELQQLESQQQATTQIANKLAPQPPAQLISKNTEFTMKPSDGSQANLSQLRAQAHLASQQGNDALVIASLRQIIALAPNDLRTRKQLAALLFSKNKMPEAQQVLVESIAQAPVDSSSRLMLARIYFKSGDNRKALQVLQAHPQNTLANDELLSFRAALSEREGEYGLAEQDYFILVQRNPKEAKWWLGLGVSQDKQRLSLEAIASYEQAQLLNQLPNQVDSFVEQRIKLLARRS